MDGQHLQGILHIDGLRDSERVLSPVLETKDLGNKAEIRRDEELTQISCELSLERGVGSYRETVVNLLQEGQNVRKRGLW